MTTAANDILSRFDRLSEAEKRDVAAEVLRRAIDLDAPELPDDALVEAADELFRELDAREQADADR